MTSTVSAVPTRVQDVWNPPGPSRKEVALGAAGAIAGHAAGLVAVGRLRQAYATFMPPAEGDDLGNLGDPGWFGPDSVIWRVHADPAMTVGGAAAVTMQGLHPRAFAGFADHTDFDSDPNGRLIRTANVLYSITYGDDAQAWNGVRHTNRAHKPVKGTMADGRTYDAREHELAMWVHITTFAAIAAAYRRFGGQRLSDADLDRYVADTAVIGRAFNLKDAPASWAEMSDMIASYRKLLCIDERSARGMSYFRDPYGVPPAIQHSLRLLWPGTLVCMPPLPRRLLMQPEPSTRDIATVRALIRGIAGVVGEPDQLVRARKRIGA